MRCKIRTIKDIFDQMPPGRIRTCMRELATLVVRAKAMQDILEKVAKGKSYPPRHPLHDRLEEATLKVDIIFTIVKGIIEDNPEVYTDKARAKKRADAIAGAWGYSDNGEYTACLHGQKEIPDSARDPMDHELHWFEDVTVLAGADGGFAIALRSITDMIENAVDKKVHTGRMPNTARLLSTILDIARAALSEKEE